MMKHKYSNWLRLMIILLGLIVVLTFVLIYNTLQESELNLIPLQHENIRNTIYISLFLFFVIAVTVYFYIPIYLKRSLGSIKAVLRDIQQGVYDNEIDLAEMKEFLDPIVYDLLIQVNEMKETINTFDNLKKEKIYEHHNRLQTVFRLIQEGGLIIDLKGRIVFINDNLREAFPQLEEDDNMLEKSYPPEIENNLKKLINASFQEKKRLDAVQCFIPNLKRHITIDSALVRDQGGEITGLVVIIHNLEKKKSEKKQEKEKGSDAN